MVCTGDNEQFLVIAGQLVVRRLTGNNGSVLSLRVPAARQSESRCCTARSTYSGTTARRSHSSRYWSSSYGGDSLRASYSRRNSPLQTAVRPPAADQPRRPPVHSCRFYSPPVRYVHSLLSLLKACLFRILAVKVAVGSHTSHVVHGHSGGSFDAGVNGCGIDRHTAPAADTDDTDMLGVHILPARRGSPPLRRNPRC